MKAVTNLGTFKKHFNLNIIVILILLTSSNVFSQNIDSSLTNYLIRFNKITHYPSISAGISIEGKVTWLHSIGYADLENNILASPKSVYRVASISKLFTAVAIMQLVEKGEINLDADARNYIPYFPKKKWKFTTRQILTHTSGIRSYKPGEFNNTKHYNSTKDALSLIKNDPLIFKPGTEYRYTTFGYNLLAAIIENVSGEPFVEYIKHHILEPAKMTSTYPELHSQIIPNRARGYMRDSLRNFINAPLADLSEKYAGGGFISTTEDLLKFGNAILDGTLIKSTTLDSILVPLKIKGKKKNVGLGFEVNLGKDSTKFFGHYGYGTGFSALFLLNRKKHIAAVDLVNIQDGAIQQPAFDLAAIALNENYKLPEYSLVDSLLRITISSNIDSAITLYNVLKNDSTANYNTSISQLNKFGEYLIRNKKFNDAVKFFRYIIHVHPNSAIIYKILAFAYYNIGEKQSAIKNLKKSYKLDNSNIYVRNLLKKLTNHEN